MTEEYDQRFCLQVDWNVKTGVKTCQQQFVCFVPIIICFTWQSEAPIYGAFKSGRNRATGFGGDNAPLLIINTPPESDSWRNIKSLAHKCWWVLALPGGRLGPDKRAGWGKKGWTKVEALSGLKGPTLWRHHFLLLIAQPRSRRGG